MHQYPCLSCKSVWVPIPVSVCVCVCTNKYMFLCVCVCLCAWMHMCDDSMSSPLIMHLLRKCCQIMLTPQPRGSVRREEMSGRERNVCVHYAYEPLPSHLIFIMCTIEKSKLLFTLEPFPLCWLTYQSRGDDMEGSSPAPADQSRSDRTGPGV